jgi:hypothetical protein
MSMPLMAAKHGPPMPRMNTGGCLPEKIASSKGPTRYLDIEWVTARPTEVLIDDELRTHRCPPSRQCRLDPGP